MESLDRYFLADFNSDLPGANSIMECDFVVVPEVAAEIGVGDFLHGSVFF